MLLAGGSLQSSSNGYRRYESHSSLEQSAVYGTAIAYRYRYSSNNLGLVSTPDIKPGESVALAITGDSYSEGQGGFPWLMELQRQWLSSPGIRSINYAIAGSGFGDFAVAALTAKKNHDARKALILFIEHDAYRPYQTMASNRHCSFYSNGVLDKILGPWTCGFYGVVWHHVPSGLSDRELVRESLARQHYGLIPALGQLMQTISASRNRPAADPAATTPKAKAPQARFGTIPQASLDAIRRIKQAYGAKQVLLVQLPDQPAAAAQSLTSARQQFQQQLQQATGLAVLDLALSCRLQPNDFHRLDNHPNSSGYRRLATCIKNNTVVEQFIQPMTEE